ncbi:MAG: MMPL family transporter [Candidatus Aenigmarchaeota archaeon]|nr:MMPL family transporter [Candidatus Aenigmarchaeota archaeon]
MISKLVKEWKVWFLALAIVWSIIVINPFAGSKGAVITTIDPESPARSYLSIGEEVNAINEVPIKGPENLAGFGEYTGVLRIFHSGKLDLIEYNNQPLGFEVKKAGSNINLGLELVGGTRALLNPVDKKGAEVVDETIATLQTRMNIYGLREMSFQPVRDVSGNNYVQVEIAGAGKKEIEDLLARQGSFGAFITRQIDIANGTASFKGDKFVFDRVLLRNGKEIKLNYTFSYGNATYHLWNYTNQTIVLAAETFTGDDIRFVYTDPQRASLQPTGGRWQFNFQILVSDLGAARFAEVTKDIPTDTGGQYLTESIHLFIDKIPVSSLRIGSSLKGQALTTPAISGGEATKKEAENEMKKLQSYLKGGSLPSKLETVKIDSISPSLGQGFISSLYIAGFLALALVSFIIFLHYREIKLVPLIMMTAIAEMLITLGFAASFRGIWTIDLASIAGIIASIGTGVNDQIIITDEVLAGKGDEDKWLNVKERVKRAFAVVIGSAAVTSVAMMPLVFVGVGVMRGFAIATIIGILVGVLVTRPAYSRIIEIVLDKK